MGPSGKLSWLWVAEGPLCTRLQQLQHHVYPKPASHQRRLGRLCSELLLLLLVLALPVSVAASSLLPRLPLARDTATSSVASGAGCHKTASLSLCPNRTRDDLQRYTFGRACAGFLSSRCIEASCGGNAGRKSNTDVLRSTSRKGNTADANSLPDRTRSSTSNSNDSRNSSSNSHAFSSTVLLPRSSLRLRGATWKSELAVQRLWGRHDTYKQLLLQIWCINKCLHHLKDNNSNTFSSSKRAHSPSDEILDSLGFAVAPPSNSIDSSDSTMLLLDGPPYANGEPHMGHAVNKCLKDFAVRAALLQRRCCHMLPGWDCHGLPIELRAAAAAAAGTKHDGAAEAHTTEMQGGGREAPNTEGTTTVDISSSRGVTGGSGSCTGPRGRAGSEELRSRARQVALHFASLQQRAFQRFGVWAHWDSAYKTLDSDFKAHELELFALLWNNGLVSPSRFPVYWSTSSLSTVPDSEVVLKPTPRDCLYFKLLLMGPRPVQENVDPLSIGKEIPWFFLAWTTTAFTIPANRALAVSASTHYAVLQASLKGPNGLEEEIWIVGEKCVAPLLEALKGAGKAWDVQQIGMLPGTRLEGLRYAHPVASRVTCPVLLDPVVADDKGTSILHVAPAHSQEDYRLCERASRGTGLLVQQSTDLTTRVHVPLLPAVGDEAAAAAAGAPLLCPVGPQGTFLGGSGSEPFKGLGAFNGGEQRVIEYLRSNNTLLLTGLLPEVFRDLQRIRWLPHRRSPKQQHNQGSAVEPQTLTKTPDDQCKTASTAAGSAVNASPGYERMRAALQTRPPTWCLSRQRQGHKFVEQWTGNANSFLSKYLPQLQQQRRHPQVEHHQPEQHRTEHQQEGRQVPQKSKELLFEGEREGYSCLVVEGSDQSRGWFQSLLLSHAGAREGLRRQRAKQLSAGALQEQKNSRQEVAAHMTETSGASVGDEASVHGKPQPATTSLGDTRLPQLPFSIAVTHGFVVDSSGNKLSKSKGNALSPDLFFSAEKEAAPAAPRNLPHAHSNTLQPQQLHRVRKQQKDSQLAYGADVLRLFVGSLDFGGDMACPSGDSQEQQQERQAVMQAASTTYVKLRNAFKYLVGSLHDFDINADVVPLNELPLFDIGMLLRLQTLADDVGKAYEVFQHNKALRLLLRFISEDFSATFIEVAKDRLYLDHPTGYRRRSCQTVLVMILLVLTQLVSPLTPHLAEEVFFRMPRKLREALAAHRRSKILEALGPAGEGFANALGLRGWPRMHLPIQPAIAAEAEQLWDLVLLLRQDVHSLFTRARQLQKGSRVGVPRVGSLNDLKLSITAPTMAKFDQLRRLLPQSELLRPAPFSNPCSGQNGRARATPSYVDDLRWLVQCSDVDIHMPRVPAGVSKDEQLADQTLLASVDEGASYSGLNMKLYRAQGPRCQRCWMRAVPSASDVSETHGPESASQHAEGSAPATTDIAREATKEVPFACQRCTDVMRHMESKS
ncbi:isoleucyl-tRNA synthetase, putative [Eimeria mitis]|uniref:Isoleucyl-tRNA synthetase, putative n=1 Tax=Eimeria mitis TaxID=44415 RepID=U6JN77_9EIME|nr:isoleucyl-tRNA synthetase, putative [Eimeria mitis]CDJ26964.1 isoleucyl-tRNA synthetase, putative [Eimeria mitis]